MPSKGLKIANRISSLMSTSLDVRTMLRKDHRVRETNQVKFMFKHEILSIPIEMLKTRRFTSGTDHTFHANLKRILFFDTN